MTALVVIFLVSNSPPEGHIHVSNGKMTVTSANIDSAMRFSPVTDNDHAGNLWILAILATAYGCLTALIRFRIKWGVLGADDGLLGVATVFLIAQAGVIFATLFRGLGKANSVTSETQWEDSGRGFLQSEILSILVLCFSKCSVIALILRVFTVERGKTWLSCCTLTLLSVVWGLCAIVGLSTNCDASSTLKPSQKSCPNQWYRWQAITAGDILTEIAMTTLPTILLWRVNMPLGAKSQVVLAFAFRLPLVALSALHLTYIYHLRNNSEPLLAVASALVVQQAMLTWSLVSATIPNMKRFMKSFDMEFGVVITRDDTTAQTDGTSEAGNTYPLQDIKPGRPYFALRPDSVRYETSAEAQDVGSVECGSSLRKSGSQETIIRKHIQWEVYSDRR